MAERHASATVVRREGLSSEPTTHHTDGNTTYMLELVSTLLVDPATSRITLDLDRIT